MARIRITVLLLLSLLVGGAFAQTVVTFDGSQNASVIPDANAYRMVYIAWSSKGPNDLNTILTNIGFSSSGDTTVIVNEMPVFLSNFNQYDLTADEDNVVSQTTGYFSTNLTPAGYTLLQNYVQAQKGYITIDNYVPAGQLAPVSASHGVTKYATPGDLNALDILENAWYYGDGYLAGLVHCRDLVSAPVMTLNDGITTFTGTLANNAGQVHHALATGGKPSVADWVTFNYGPAICGGMYRVHITSPISVEYAYTRIMNIQGLGSGPFTRPSGATYYTWRTQSYCLNVPIYSFPDWDPLAMDDVPPLLPNPWGWDTEAICARALGSKWECVDTIFFPPTRFYTNPGPKNCTYNP